MPKKKNYELVADIYEALEALRRWKPVYLAVLRRTKDKQQALDAIKYLFEIEKEMENEAGSESDS